MGFMRVLFSFILCCLFHSGYANDGVFYASGNQLIPIQETDIRVQKEILSIKKVGTKYAEINVYYEFYNPVGEKELLVGFEAMSPSGDVDARPKNGAHPNMYNFTVEMNTEILDYEVAIVEDSPYFKEGSFISRSEAEVLQTMEPYDMYDLTYVYHFKAKFKKGLNIVKHTYLFDLSGSVATRYDISYVLTAAKRWANQQIDDFTLIIDMGDFEDFSINSDFFSSKDEWLIHGIGKSRTLNKEETLDGEPSVKFIIQKGQLIFQKKDFKPAGELFIYAINQFFDQNDQLPFSPEEQHDISDSESETERRILRNLPFARRGYVFKDKALLNYYSKHEWYIPNPNYRPDVEMLLPKEQEWVKKQSK